MKYRFAICDDEVAQQDALSRMVRQWARVKECEVSVACFPSAEVFLFRYVDDKSYDILLLDIEMGGMSGVELAKAVRAGNKEVQIIFITGFMEYIADGYEVEALHYLLKPVTEDKLFTVFDRAVQRLRRNERALLLDFGGEQVRVPLYEIRYIEAQRNYVTVHTAQHYTMRSTLGELERELDGNFFRIGRSFIVNLRYIRKMTRTDILLSDGTTILLPRGSYDTINQAMMKTLRG